MDADCIFAFVGGGEWPYDNGDKRDAMESESDNDGNLGGGILSAYRNQGTTSGSNEVSYGTEGWITSVTCNEARPLQKVLKLLPGERLGWWSAKKFDRRIRMRALVKGALNDNRTRILLDTGANVSVISASFARKLRIRDIQGHGRSIDVQGINEGKVSTTRRALVKITLGWDTVYEFEIWIMQHNAGVDVVLGTDFMIPAGIRLDLFNSTAQLPNEVMIPLIKTANMTAEDRMSSHSSYGPIEDLNIPGREQAYFKLPRRQHSAETHDVWVRRTTAWVPTVTTFWRGQPRVVRLTNVTEQLTSCPRHFPVLQLVPVGDLPRFPGYVKMTSKKYEEWQVLAYAESKDRSTMERERILYDRWLAAQPSPVERPAYSTPKRIRARPAELSAGDNRQLSCAERWEKIFRNDDSTAQESDESSVDTSHSIEARCDGIPFDPGGQHGVMLTGKTTDGHGCPNEVSGRSVAQLEQTFVSVFRGLTTEGNATLSGKNENSFEHPANEIGLEDYAHELAFLPDLTEESTTVLDYAGANVVNPDLTAAQQKRLVQVLKKHEGIMISSGNALPPPAYGVVCDIDVQGHAPIKQRARRIPLRHLRQLYELLKGLLKAGLIAFSDSPWASPIVIVLKKNGQDIRLCIDYKMVNAVTAIMEYAMPLVDDLLTDLECYLWFCSLDAASGFWAIMMTLRARKVSAFVCALGHFEWLRMPFGLKNAPMIYQRMIDNALWGFVQPRGGWKHYANLMREAEEQAKLWHKGSDEVSLVPPNSGTAPRTKFEADRETSVEADPVLQLINSPVANMFAHGEIDESLLVPVFDRRSFVDDICFGGETFESCLATLDQLLTRFTECRISVSFTKSIFAQSKVDFLSHEVSARGIQADAKKMKAITELSFPQTKKGMQSFLGALNYYSRFIQDFAVYGAALYQLKDDDFGPRGDLSAAQRAFTALKQKVAEAPILRHFDRSKPVHVMLFANEWALSTTLMQEHDGKLHPVRFAGRVLKDSEMNYHPAEKEVLALLLLLKVCYTQLAGRVIHVYTRFSTLEWVHKSKSLFGRTTQFAVMLSPWHLKIERVKERDCTFTQLLQSTITNFMDLEDTLAPIAPPSKGSPMIRMDPNLLYAKLPRDYRGFVVSFDGSAKTEKYGGYGSCSWIVWKLPEWSIAIAANAYLSSTTVNIAEYTGMNNGVIAAIEQGAEDLVIVGDSRLAIQQSLGVIACRKEALMAQLNRHKDLVAKLKTVKYLHVVREYNAAADSLATESLETKTSRVILGEARKAELTGLNRIQEMLYAPEELEHAEISVMTRQQAKSKRKRVRFANEVPSDTDQAVTKPQGTTVEPNETSGHAEALARGEETTPHEPSVEELDPVEIQAERRRRISKAQDEELRWKNLKLALRGSTEDLPYKEARDALKWADNFVLSEDSLLYYLGSKPRSSRNPREETKLRLVVPTTMIQEVLHTCHDTLEGGHQGVTRTYHRVKADFYWIGLFADVEKHVKSCPDCCTSKSRPQLKGMSPGNVLADRPFQIVSMDFVIPLPKSRSGNTALLLFQCSFTGFVIAKAMSDTSAIKVAQAFEECIYRRFGAPSLIRHDRDPRFMSEVFQVFAEMLQSRSRATLSYRPQANGQQERSVKSVMTSVRVYVEDPLQRDWDEIAERLVFAINNSQDTTRKETPFYLVHGWDAQSTMKAMTTSLQRGHSRQSDALAWRREVNRQQEIAFVMAKDYQATEKKRRADEHNKTLSRLEKASNPSQNDNETSVTSSRSGSSPDDRHSRPPRSPFTEGSRVWLYMERVKPGLVKKLAHRWHGPFRIKRKVEDFAFELELPDRSGYRFYPVVHISRLKAVNEFSDRPTTRLALGVTDDTRLDFDEELLPEDSWEPDQVTGEYEVEAILGDRMPLSTSTGRSVREFQVKWVGYDEPTWEPMANLSCGGLLFDYLRRKKSDQRLQMVQVADEE